MIGSEKLELTANECKVKGQKLKKFKARTHAGGGGGVYARAPTQITHERVRCKNERENRLKRTKTKCDRTGQQRPFGRRRYFL